LNESGDSDGVVVNLQFAKVDLKSRVKRIASPSCNLELFAKQVQSHFSELKDLQFNPID